MPALISSISSSSSVASRASTMRATSPSSSRTTRPSRPGSIVTTVTSAIAALDRLLGLEQQPEQTRVERAARRRRPRGPRSLRRQDPERREQGVGRPAWLVLEREVGRVGEGLGDRDGRGRIDHERARTGRGRGRLDDVPEHRPAAQLVEDLRTPRLHPRPESGGEDDRDGPGRVWFGLHQGWGIVGASRAGCQTPRGPRPTLTDVRRRPRSRSGATGQGAHRERRASRRRVGLTGRIDRVDGGEVADVGEEDRRLHDVRPAETGRREDGGQVVERALGLRLDAARPARRSPDPARSDPSRRGTGRSRWPGCTGRGPTGLRSS